MSNQQGTVIITALLFMTIVTAIVIAMAFKQHLNLSQTQMVLDSSKLWLAQETMATHAEDYLLKSFSKPQFYNKNEFTQSKVWKPPVLKNKIDGVIYRTKILDAQSFLDINALKTQSVKNSPKLLSAESMFQQLINEKIPKKESVRNNIFKEAQAYVSHTLRISPQYKQLPKLPMVSITELRLLPSMSGEVYQSFFNADEPNALFALPAHNKQSHWKMNINTIRPGLLKSLLPNFPIDTIKKRPFNTMSDISESGYMNFNEYFDVTSSFFLIKTQALTHAFKENTVVYRLIQAVDVANSKEKRFKTIWISMGTV